MCFFSEDGEIDGFQGKFHDFWVQIGETLPDRRLAECNDWYIMLAFLSQVVFLRVFTISGE